MATGGGRTVRQGQAPKRAAILAAAKELFVRTGVERTSMDAVAALAGVSKRTVYDYYGDKRGLLLGVVEDAGERALATLRELVDEHLNPADIREPADLERALTELAAALGRTLLLSSDYLAAVRLINENEALLPELEDHPLDEAHARVLSDRISHFARVGLLDADDPGLAAAHFHALTALRVLNEPPRRRTEAAHVRQIMTDGARAFVRAYGAQGPAE
ncbi:TetR/AcrR family transcriptional regulator [Cellulomonas gilvus]|uniref:Regulatory protein TetR n=1 Tax=Cellulomonas gilvus (strain ATCC 13127 / NRRL B-14078) TaxID=593907 RepID=F8A679_CELGA|nr:TetR/AcrR family transcriptional regulator [Cellulomonas gilvus]AEI12235.1 regulatory protein TetR [Cellulomonas gilvus ATCC 13127]